MKRDGETLARFFKDGFDELKMSLPYPRRRGVPKNPVGETDSGAPTMPTTRERAASTMKAKRDKHSHVWVLVGIDEVFVLVAGLALFVDGFASSSSESHTVVWCNLE